MSRAAHCRSRHSRFRTRSVGDKSLVVFDNPSDIKGTALLSHAQILDPDNQWLYLPALKRVKRISSANKSGPFVGSEFAFEDFTALELNKYDYKWVREEEAVDGLQADIVERTPRYENSGYTRQVTWVDRDVHQVRKVEFYDRRGDLLKTLMLADYREYDRHLAQSSLRDGESPDRQEHDACCMATTSSAWDCRKTMISSKVAWPGFAKVSERSADDQETQQ